MEKDQKFKGITKATIKNKIIIDDLKNAIYDVSSKYVTNYTIESKKHHLETKEQSKIAIHPFDDKGNRESDGEVRFYK